MDIYTAIWTQELLNLTEVQTKEETAQKWTKIIILIC